jgi:hypothetical protein
VTTYKRLNGIEKVGISTSLSLDNYEEVKKLALEKEWSVSKTVEFMVENYVKLIKK